MSKHGMAVKEFEGGSVQVQCGKQVTVSAIQWAE